MNLYLMRHCEPTPGDPMDATRELTAAGIKQANDMAAFMVREVGHVQTVICSPFERSKQTAVIMAAALGSPVVAETRMLQPDGEPVTMWEEITRLAADAPDVLVVGHHPSIVELMLWLIAGGNASADEGVKFKHGAIAHLQVGNGDGDLHWFVTPALVAKDEAEQETLEAAREMTAEDFPDLVKDVSARLLADYDIIVPYEGSNAQAVIENLSSKERKPKVDPLIKKVQDACAARFRAQARKAKAGLLHLEDSFDKDDSDTPPASLNYAMIGALALAPAATDDFVAKYTRATSRAYDAGAGEIETALGIDNTGEWIPDGHALAAELDKTTIERLETAIIDIYSKSDVEYSDLVDAVAAVFVDAISSRAEMTAVTEIATAWNRGAADAAQTAVDNGGNIEKAWVTEDDPCPECEENEAEGWIDFDDTFPSGDDQPPAHPNCKCSLEMRTAK